MSGSRRAHLRGVRVDEYRGKRGVRYYARYTLADGTMAPVSPSDSWDEAFEKAAEEQRKVNRCAFRDARNGRMTFAQLVSEQWAPTQAELGMNTKANHASHLGNIDGTPCRKGREAARSARFALLARFGRMRIQDIAPQHVRLWQAEMVEAGYKVSSIEVKRNLLKGILQFAVDQGWIDVNPVLAVKKPAKAPVKDSDDRTFTPAEWALVRLRLSGELTLLLVDLLLDTGLRFGEITALRPRDLLDADEVNPVRVRICRNVVWPGRRFTGTGLPWHINDFTKTKRDRTVAVSPFLFARFLDYIDRFGLTPDALIFDIARMRAEHAERRERDPIKGQPHGRYVNPKTGRSGPHGEYYTYDLGCRCIYCRNSYTEYRFWRARRLGRRSVQPWRDPDFVASRADAVDPMPNQWFNPMVWHPAVDDVLTEWSPTPHQLRHAMVTWTLHQGVSPRIAQLDAGHASLSTTEGYAHRLDKLAIPTERIGAMAKMYALMEAPPDGFTPRPTPLGGAAALDAATVRDWLAAQEPQTVAQLMVDALRGEPATPPLRPV